MVFGRGSNFQTARERRERSARDDAEDQRSFPLDAPVHLAKKIGFSISQRLQIPHQPLSVVLFRNLLLLVGQVRPVGTEVQQVCLLDLEGSLIPELSESVAESLLLLVGFRQVEVVLRSRKSPSKPSSSSDQGSTGGEDTSTSVETTLEGSEGLDRAVRVNGFGNSILVDAYPLRRLSSEAWERGLEEDLGRTNEQARRRKEGQLGHGHRRDLPSFIKAMVLMICKRERLTWKTTVKEGRRREESGSRRLVSSTTGSPLYQTHRLDSKS